MRLCLYDLFDRLAVSYEPTQAKFMLFDARRPATEMYTAMIKHGVLVRPCASFGLPTSLRVTIGTPEGNQRFAQALEKVLKE